MVLGRRRKGCTSLGKVAPWACGLGCCSGWRRLLCCCCAAASSSLSKGGQAAALLGCSRAGRGCLQAQLGQHGAWAPHEPLQLCSFLHKREACLLRLEDWLVWRRALCVVWRMRPLAVLLQRLSPVYRKRARRGVAAPCRCCCRCLLLQGAVCAAVSTGGRLQGASGWRGEVW